MERAWHWPVGLPLSEACVLADFAVGAGSFLMRVPQGLGVAGKRFWNEIHAEFDVNEGEERLLREACRTLDELDRPQAELATVPLLVAGSTGQPKPHPLLEEVRKHREVLQRLIGGLAVPAKDAAVGKPAAPVSARRAARVRWMGDAR